MVIPLQLQVGEVEEDWLSKGQSPAVHPKYDATLLKESRVLDQGAV